MLLKKKISLSTNRSTDKEDVILLSHKKEWKISICNNMEGIRLSEINQTKTNTVWYHLYVGPKKYNKLVNTTKQKQTHRFWEQTSGYQWGQGRGSIGAEEVQTTM